MKFPKEACIVVIGGGVMGTSAAFHLAQDGHRDVVLLDRGPLASGTTPFAAGQTGFLNTMTGSKEGLPIARYSLDFYENFADRTGYPVNFRQSGSLRVALTDRYRGELDDWMAQARSFNFPAEWISPEEAQKLAPILDPSEAKGIILIPRDGYVEPKGVAVAYACGARDLGVNIQTRVRATGLEVADGRIKGVRTSRGDIRAEWVVVAAGAWTRQFGMLAGISVKSVPVRHQSLVTAPIAKVLPGQPVVRIVEPQLYARPEKGGLLVGGYGFRQVSFNMAKDFPDDFTIPALTPDPIYYHRLWAAATRFFPDLQNAIVVQEQAGLPTMTPDARHIVSQVPAAKGLIFTTGCQVGGVSISPAIGRMVADLVGGREGLVPSSTFDAGRFGTDYDEEAALRSKCEELYGRQYLRLG